MTTETSPSSTPLESQNRISYPIWVFLSVAFGQFMIDFIEAVFHNRVLDFWENEIGFETALISLAFIIYAIWNMFNDPLIGYIADKPRKFWGKWGKRFPWIIGGGIPWVLCFILLFTVPAWDPDTQQIPLFLWLLISICLYDTLFSIYDTSYNGLIPDKFRTDRDRVRQSAWANVLSIIGGVMAVFIGPGLITYGDRRSFLTMAVAVCIIGLGVLLIQIPGLKETKIMRERLEIQSKQSPPESFFKLLKKAIRQRNFLAYLIIYLCYQSCNVLMTSSIAYVNRFILGGPEDDEMLIMGGYILLGMLSIPFWAFISRKKGQKFVFMICALIIVGLMIPLIFITTLIPMVIVVGLMGVGLLGFAVMLLPILGDVIDEAVVIHRRRRDTFYMGVRTFFGRISVIIQALTIGIVHIATGFNEGASTQPPSAIFGIRIQVAIVPMILMLIGTVVFWKLYTLTDAQKAENKRQLVELNL